MLWYIPMRPSDFTVEILQKFLNCSAAICFFEIDYLCYFFLVKSQEEMAAEFLQSHMTSDFLGNFWPTTYPNQILYYISLSSKIRCSLTYLPKYLPKNLTSYVNALQNEINGAQMALSLVLNKLFGRNFVRGVNGNIILKEFKSNSQWILKPSGSGAQMVRFKKICANSNIIWLFFRCLLLPIWRLETEL